MTVGLHVTLQRPAWFMSPFAYLSVSRFHAYIAGILFTGNLLTHIVFLKVKLLLLLSYIVVLK